MAATTYASIFDVADDEGSITLPGRPKPFQLHPIGSKDALRLRKRFPDFKGNIENLQFLVQNDDTDDDLTDDTVDRLVRVIEFTNAMVAVALGHAGDEKAEARIDTMFSEDEKAAIISRAQGLSVATPDEGFSKRSA